MIRRIIAFTAVLLFAFGLWNFSAYSEEIKLGHVDLRRAFYEYDKTKEMEEELGHSGGHNS